MKKFNTRLLSATFLSSLLFSINHSYALTIENPTNGGAISPWGGGGATSIYGQTIKLTDSQYNKLDNFTFYLGTTPDSSPISFDAYIYKWDSTSNKIVGNAVFEQKNLLATTNNTNSTPTIAVVVSRLRSS